jgi:RalA-binding protein 1
LDSDEYWDPHAVAGLLKSFLRELPASILTRDLHLRFLAVIGTNLDSYYYPVIQACSDFVDPQERIHELSQLIGALPLANYSLLRALTAHLILVVQNSGVNKMTMRNVGIVFSPTLGIPAGVFSLMLGEFNRVFNVDAGKEDPELFGEPASVRPPADRSGPPYDVAAERLLGLSGRSLTSSYLTVTRAASADVLAIFSAAPDDSTSEGSVSEEDESGPDTTENETTIESSGHSSAKSSQPSFKSDHHITGTSPDTPTQSTQPTSKAAQTAANRGLTLSDRGNRHSRILGLPPSPHPGRSPVHSNFHNGPNSPALRAQGTQ